MSHPFRQGFGKFRFPNWLAIELVEQFRDQTTLPGSRQGFELRDRVSDHNWQDTGLEVDGKRIRGAHQDSPSSAG